MDSMKAFAMGAAARAAGAAQMVFDWDEAARRIVASGAKNAEAGLAGDWGYTGGEILRDGEPVTDSYTYLSSNWATPELDLGDGGEPCYRMQDKVPDWSSHTKWPESALAILKAGKDPA